MNEDFFKYEILWNDGYSNAMDAIHTHLLAYNRMNETNGKLYKNYVKIYDINHPFVDYLKSQKYR